MAEVRRALGQDLMVGRKVSVEARDVAVPDIFAGSERDLVGDRPRKLTAESRRNLIVECAGRLRVEVVRNLSVVAVRHVVVEGVRRLRVEVVRNLSVVAVRRVVVEGVRGAPVHPGRVVVERPGHVVVGVDIVRHLRAEGVRVREGVGRVEHPGRVAPEVAQIANAVRSCQVSIYFILIIMVGGTGLEPVTPAM